MKKIFDFGGIDYYNKGVKSNAVTIEMEYKMKDDKKVLSICGNIWNRRKSDIICGGQCLDEIAKYVKDDTFIQIYRLWNLYHLNDMHPECVHQHDLGWSEQATEEITIYQWLLTADSINQLAKIKEKALYDLQNGKKIQLSSHDQFILSLKYSHKSWNEELSDELKPYYKKGDDSGHFAYKEIKKKGLTYEKEHPQGLLCKPCPICGYKYGSSWVYNPIPKEDEQLIYELLEAEEETQ